MGAAHKNSTGAMYDGPRDDPPMKLPLIRSRQNQRVKSAAKLRDRRQREKQGRFLIDGVREIRRAIQAKLALAEAFVCQPLPDDPAARQTLELLEGCGAPLHGVTPEVFAKLAFGDRSDGIVAVGHTPQRSLADLQLPPQALVAVLEGVEKPGNIGAIARSADAAGVAALLLADGGTDIYNPNAIRASTGTLFALPTVAAATTQVREWLREQEFPVYAADPAARLAYTECDFRGNVAILLGSEATGVSAVWPRGEVTKTRLPMCGTADSLNVSAAAAVLFFEAMRQRGAAARERTS